MLNNQHISVVMPALDEELAIPKVIRELRQLWNTEGKPLIDDIVVCDNGSRDGTSEVAQTCGARVVYQPEKGYGLACQSAIEHLTATDIVLFVDADDSCVIEQAHNLVNKVASGESYDIAIGSRSTGVSEAGALTVPQQFGNWLATVLINLLWDRQITDLGPFRAIRFQALRKLDMEDRRFGWTVEMQIKAIQQDLKMTEIPVDSKRRIGVSKISGTISGVVGAGLGILGKIAWLWLSEKKGSRVVKALAP